MSDSEKQIKFQEALNSVSPKFQELSPLLNKHPYAFKIEYSETQGEYILIIREDFLFSDDPIALSKSAFSPKHL